MGQVSYINEYMKSEKSNWPKTVLFPRSFAGCDFQLPAIERRQLWILLLYVLSSFLLLLGACSTGNLSRHRKQSGGLCGPHWFLSLLSFSRLGFLCYTASVLKISVIKFWIFLRRHAAISMFFCSSNWSGFVWYSTW